VSFKILILFFQFSTLSNFTTYLAHNPNGHPVTPFGLSCEVRECSDRRFFDMERCDCRCNKTHRCEFPKDFNRTTCSCECPSSFSADSCLNLEKFDENFCTCFCPHPRDFIGCGRNKMWNFDICSCTCRDAPTDCTNGAFWSTDTCYCVGMTRSPLSPAANPFQTTPFPRMFTAEIANTRSHIQNFPQTTNEQTLQSLMKELAESNAKIEEMKVVLVKQIDELLADPNTAANMTQLLRELRAEVSNIRVTEIQIIILIAKNILLFTIILIISHHQMEHSKILMCLCSSSCRFIAMSLACGLSSSSCLLCCGTTT
jgi:hypothetical protein